MKAAIRRKYGNPDVLTVENITKPTPQEGEVLVKVHATTVSRTDCAILTGKPFIMQFFIGLGKPKVPTLGTDFAGVVEAVGSGVESLKVGGKVWGFGDEGIDSQAEYMCFPVKDAIGLMPENISFEQAAASLEGAHYAYNFMNKVDLKAGQKILVNGATGAIGSAMLQFLKAQGLYVTAVCNTKNIPLIQSLGADKIYDYLQEDFTKDTEKYDCIFDAVGKSTFGKCKSLLKKKGTYISSELGPKAQNPFLAMITPFFGGKKVLFPLPSNVRSSMEFIKNLIEKDQFRPVIDQTLPLEKIAEAYRYVLTGEKTGNVVIRMVDF
ncbi:MAG: NAD(P)-dependent alcohol dehydrogenase [Chitinophagales bacterium]